MTTIYAEKLLQFWPIFIVFSQILYNGKVFYSILS